MAQKPDYIAIKEVLNQVDELISNFEMKIQDQIRPTLFAYFFNTRFLLRSKQGHKIALVRDGTKDLLDFKGLSGGLRLLISDGFFDELRGQKEIYEELRRRGYNYPKNSLPEALLRFLRNRELGRVIGDDSKWKYSIRK